ncbi:hypothetical protein LTR05_000944 [Lithohypha guttulata]|uniref:Uncharacterized protein n=1 Tax=Lithohypha guttulata TaxID=1690604 RepID=A0AAN7YJT0_9EURO|nr:hypothetical protein LTR05_000944 [Lithohypha guttulata]
MQSEGNTYIRLRDIPPIDYDLTKSAWGDLAADMIDNHGVDEEYKAMDEDSPRPEKRSKRVKDDAKALSYVLNMKEVTERSATQSHYDWAYRYFTSVLRNLPHPSSTSATFDLKQNVGSKLRNKRQDNTAKLKKAKVQRSTTEHLKPVPIVGLTKVESSGTTVKEISKEMPAGSQQAEQLHMLNDVLADQVSDLNREHQKAKIAKEVAEQQRDQARSEVEELREQVLALNKKADMAVASSNHDLQAAVARARKLDNLLAQALSESSFKSSQITEMNSKLEKEVAAAKTAGVERYVKVQNENEELKEKIEKLKDEAKIKVEDAERLEKQKAEFDVYQKENFILKLEIDQLQFDIRTKTSQMEQQKASFKSAIEAMKK